jgi:2-dehydro-3-deoxyphosphogluconate aldolase/(4S)-4-hydroxy-2-oxoglutarate aldolase
VIGAGTVLTDDDAKAAVDAGAAFLVSPVSGLGPQPVPLYPGAFSPTEVYAAQLSGAPIVKLFPAGGLGPGYLKDLRGPLPGVRIMPTGGIGLDDIAKWLAAGAVAVGLGGPLIGDAATGGSLTALAARARHAVDAVTFARS